MNYSPVKLKQQNAWEWMYDVLTKIASRVKPGADGLIFHPYLAGERAPLWNANARGSFFGLTLSHQKNT